MVVSTHHNCRVPKLGRGSPAYLDEIMINYALHRYEGDTPLPLAYCVPPYFGLAYCVPPFCWPRILRTVYQQKTTIWGVSIYIKKINKMTICRISGVRWHTPVRTCVRWTTEIRKKKSLKMLKMALIICAFLYYINLIHYRESLF